MRPRRRTAALALAAAALAASAVYVWWDAPATQRLSSASPEIAPMPLPDVARLDPSLQQQVRERHAEVTALLDDRAAGDPQRAHVAGSYGMLLLATEYLPEAEAVLLRAETLAPADMRWPYYLGHVYRQRQEPARAIAAFERVLALAPDDVPTLTWLGELHLATGNAEAAEPYLQRAAARQPTSAAAVSRLGRAALARRDYPRAIEHLQHALQLRPDASSLYYPLGMAYRGAGDVQRAEAYLRRATNEGTIPPADPLLDAVSGLLQNADAYEARGMEALDARNWPVAVENLRKAAELAPQNAVTRLNLGMALSLSGDAAAARRELLEAVRLDPRAAKAHFGLGLLAEDEGRWSEAIDRFTTAVRHDPTFVDAHFTLAEALRRVGRVEESLAHYDDVLRLNAGASQARFGRAMALVRLRRYPEARRALEEAVRLHPEQPGFPHALARVLAAAPDAGVRDGQRALALMQPLRDQRSAAVSETIGMTLAELGRFSEAVEWQQRAIALAREAGQPALAARMQDNLGRYRQGQPCRVPWRDDDPVLTARP